MPAPTTRFSIRARIYVALVIAAGLAILIHALTTLVASPPSTTWLILAGLALLSATFNIKIPSIPARISISEAFVFATVLLYGMHAATVVVTLDAMMMSLRLRTDRKAWYRAPFNISAAALAIWLSARIYLLVLGPGRAAADVSLDVLLLPLLVLALSYFVLLSGLMALAMSYERGVPPFTLWRANFLWLGLNYLGGASFAALIVSYQRPGDLAMVSVIIPLLVIMYLTYRTSLGRLEDANRHVNQLNELYLSTIETLAMAVDAKDQITHGHIRRVQVYATELARRLGVSDQNQLRAIEAAALLHDMGKLAIPENILNKPGRLSPAEFDKVKQHADIGADLLSAIRFPYPVVPIVRHHHEHWDGHGYPSGISKTDIPLGARILSVVDCFDALTSDRPYRPRLSAEEAFRVLQERRGAMYDPLVVDTFVGSYAEIGPVAIAAGQQARSLLPSGYSEPETLAIANNGLKQIRASAAETTLIFEVNRTLTSCTSASEAFECAAQYIRQQTPATICAFFRQDSQGEVLNCAFASGEGAEFLMGLTIRRGERITGWAAANSETICNSDPALDLGNIANSFRQPLKSALSAPLAVQGRTIGVLTLYSPSVNAFSSEHSYSVEQIAGPLGDRLVQLLEQGEKVVSPFLEARRRTLRPSR